MHWYSGFEGVVDGLEMADTDTIDQAVTQGTITGRAAASRYDTPLQVVQDLKPINIRTFLPLCNFASI